jgi:7,8-dihydropterin-6-yl-methyl-4-(beta-D-ribofuranosyl)aminobenzene 5'-phosphate synthase
MNHRKLTIAAGLSLIAALAVMSPGPSSADELASSVTVTILSSNLASGATVGEWGFSALVEADGKCVLFDTGRHPDTVQRNAAALDVDLSCVTDVVLSHFHFDHTTGLIPLVDSLREKNPDAIRRVHVAEGFFLPRRVPARYGDIERNTMIEQRPALEGKGVRFIEHSGPAEILPAIWITGPVERNNIEHTFGKDVEVLIDDDWVEDFVPGSQGLTVATADGPVVLLGCGHSGSVNLLQQVRRSIQDHTIHALMGGMHLFSADERTLDWTAAKLREIGVQHLMAGHCTGVEPLMHLRTGLGLSRNTAVIGAVGSRFVYGEGIYPTAIAR